INRERIYMMWRRYRVKEYLSVTRCFKCHGYGHIAKNCACPDQLCEICGSKEHLKANCGVRDKPRCINCVRNRRKDQAHNVRSNECP
ncbi:Uncharacterized 50 kDa protein in type I retrotransposable element R1DM, partial [Camponotus floridanus]